MEACLNKISYQNKRPQKRIIKQSVNLNQPIIPEQIPEIPSQPQSQSIIFNTISQNGAISQYPSINIIDKSTIITLSKPTHDTFCVIKAINPDIEGKVLVTAPKDSSIDGEYYYELDLSNFESISLVYFQKLNKFFIY